MIENMGFIESFNCHFDFSDEFYPWMEISVHTLMALKWLCHYQNKHEVVQLLSLIV